ncbi:hypothetical protein NDU88_002089 [Pleurodeles waltl]|uniref:Uncharacterized protein n=1 Tax=Pleurodeles waltl TaxID=8319 RepID=A0AAV7Q4Y7_PLEWA|nr:hypothetical protein NDU88_002089 [Pleurodeles waltl]
MGHRTDRCGASAHEENSEELQHMKKLVRRWCTEQTGEELQHMKSPVRRWGTGQTGEELGAHEETGKKMGHRTGRTDRKGASAREETGEEMGIGQTGEELGAHEESVRRWSTGQTGEELGAHKETSEVMGSMDRQMKSLEHMKTSVRAIPDYEEIISVSNPQDNFFYVACKVLIGEYLFLPPALEKIAKLGAKQVPIAVP